MKPARILSVLTALVMVLSAASAGASAEPPDAPTFPTADEIASAIPRDLVIDRRGLGYLRGVDGSLTPYGHDVAAERRPLDPRARGGIPGPPGGGGGSGGDVVTNAHWTFGGRVQTAAGRILFELADGWYVCSGTVVTEAISGRSIVLTAAHCVYDDVKKEFSRQAIFIPSQDDGGSDRTDWNCGNDPYGCWSLDHGVVDVDWTTRTFPDNIPWDYGYYVVSDSGAHTHSNYPWTWTNETLDNTVGSLAADFSTPVIGEVTHALGYSYNVDPNFMYCSEAMSTNGSANYWLGKCDLSGGSSGGPWVQPMVSGSGPVISVNSWGYTFQSGMAGPKLNGTSASVLFDYAETSTMGPTDNGYIVDPGGGGGGAGGGGDDFTTSSVNNGPTWTAIVENGTAFSGSFVGYQGATCTKVTSCPLSGIPKKTGSVMFQVAEGGPLLTIYKP